MSDNENSMPRLERGTGFMECLPCAFRQEKPVSLWIGVKWERKKAAGLTMVEADVDKLATFARALGFVCGATTWAAKSIEIALANATDEIEGDKAVPFF